MSKNTRNRILLTAVAALLLVVMAVGGTLAYLVAESDTVQNTFKPVDFDIALTETCDDEFNLVPGVTYDKDPKVTVSNLTTPIWLFVEYEASENIEDYLTFETNLNTIDGWEHLEGNIWYRHVTANGEFYLLDGDATDTVTVKNTIVKTDVANEDTDVLMPGSNLTMTFTAYACQYIGFEDSAADAWAVAQNNGMPVTVTP